MSKEISEILNIKSSNSYPSKDFIYGYSHRQNIQQFTKTPAKCYLCKVQIRPFDFYISVAAIKYKGRTRYSTSRKLCGGCDGYKEIVKIWNSTNDKHRKAKAKRDEENKPSRSSGKTDDWTLDL